MASKRKGGVKIAKDKQQTFETKSGRLVKDGGGIESDLSVIQPKASTLEVALLQSNTFDDFADVYLKTHDSPEHGFKVDEKIFGEFKKYVKEQQGSGKLKLEEILVGRGEATNAADSGDNNGEANSEGESRSARLVSKQHVGHPL